MRATVISVLNPAGPSSQDDRVFALGDEHGEAMPEFGYFREAAGAQQKADEVNALSDSEFEKLCTDWANN